MIHVCMLATAERLGSCRGIGAGKGGQVVRGGHTVPAQVHTVPTPGPHSTCTGPHGTYKGPHGTGIDSATYKG